MVMSNDPEPCTYDSTRNVFLTLWVIGNLFGLSVFALLLTWILRYGGGFSVSSASGLFSYHVILMGIFVIFLQGNGSLIYRLIPATPKYTSKLIHASIQFLVCIGMTFALVAIIKEHDLSNQPHFTSLHSWIGISTICCYYLQFIFGFFMFLYPSGSSLEVKVRSMSIHRGIGRSLFIAAVAAAVSGIMENAMFSLGDAYSALPQNALILNFTGLLAVLFVVSVIYLLSDHTFRRRPPPLQQSLPGSIGQSIYYGATTSAAARMPTTSTEKVVY